MGAIRHRRNVDLNYYTLWMLLVFLHGLLALAGAVLVIEDLLTLRPAAARVEEEAVVEPLRLEA